MGNLIPMGRYFASEWSYAQIHGLESKTVVAFGATDYTITVIGANGNFLVCNFEEEGECKKVTTDRLIRSSQEEEDDREFDPPVMILPDGNGSHQIEDNNGNHVETMKVPSSQL